MLSRVAESIYWMSRYIERADNVARFIDVNLHMILDMVVGPDTQWMPLVSTTGDTKEFSERFGEATREKVIRFLTFDAGYSNSILSCVKRARENARSVREVISSEMWEQINSFYLMVTDAARNVEAALDSPRDFMRKSAGHRSSSPESLIRRCRGAKVGISTVLEPCSNERIRPRESSMSSTSSCCRPSPTSAPPSTTFSGQPS